MERLLVTVLVAMGLVVVACGGSASRSSHDDPVAARTALEEPTRAAAVVVDDEAQDQYDAAVVYLADAQPGLAVVAINQALARQPDFAEAARVQPTIVAAATAVVISQERAIAVAAQVEATKAAQVEVEARASATAQAQAQANAQVQAQIASYTRTPPKGEWWTSTPVARVAVGPFEYRMDLGRFKQAQPGYRFVAFGMVVDNQSGQSLHVNPTRVTLVDQEGVTHTYDNGIFSHFVEPLRAVDVRPGDRAGGGSAFLLRSTTGPARVIFRTPGLRSNEIVVNLERAPDRPL